MAEVVVALLDDMHEPNDLLFPEIATGNLGIICRVGMEKNMNTCHEDAKIFLEYQMEENVFTSKIDHSSMVILFQRSSHEIYEI